MTVAFQGEPGAYSEAGVFQAFGASALPFPCATFADVFEAVTSGRAAGAVVPVENSQAGSVIEAYDLLVSSSLAVVGEIRVLVNHCLLALPGQTLADIRQVMSHPQALAQCAAFVTRIGAVALAALDTAGSARLVAGEGLRGVGAIASANAGVLYGLEVLEQGIQTVPDNYTRMFVLAPAGSVAPGPHDKTSLVLSLPHEAGALYRALGAFATRGLNLSRIESRPSRQTPWEYVFYLDFEGDPESAKGKKALEELHFHGASVKVLGSYTKAP